MFNSASAVFVATGFDPADTPLKSVQDKLDIAMMILAILPALLLASHMLWQFLEKRKEKEEREGERSLAVGSEYNGCDSDSRVITHSLNGNGGGDGAEAPLPRVLRGQGGISKQDAACREHDIVMQLRKDIMASREKEQEMAQALRAKEIQIEDLMRKKERPKVEEI